MFLGQTNGNSQEQYQVGSADIDTQIRDVFNTLDQNGNKYVSLEELRVFIADTQEAREMIRQYDFDGDSRINYEEFKEIMNSR